MTTMIRELYKALKEAGASEEKSIEAAEALAAYEDRFHRMDVRLTLLTWMVGVNIALTLGVLLKLYN